ncbi:peroxidase-like [Centruroides sculpturatus]|uniref:peroxidase-like n=1 Tax=Centruroides sculpturatus TaxID=218467 RepID=UPI000C6D1C51|nr:peroxidase-like [Centruroides sculpturatus]XP_023243051.1 peroxidase-like [Centruroides sculpturatus]
MKSPDSKIFRWVIFPLCFLLTLLNYVNVDAQFTSSFYNFDSNTVPFISRTAMNRAFIRAKQKILHKRQHEKTLTTQGRVVNPSLHPAVARHQRFTMTYPRAVSLERVRELFEGATEELANSYHLSRKQIIYGLPKIPLVGREAQEAAQQCSSQYDVQCEEDKYRSFDGSCNNLEHPTWGKTFTCFQRLLPPAYADSISAPRIAVSGRPLPPARVLSILIHRNANVPSHIFTHMFMVWGQFVDHDITLTPISRSTDNAMIQCCPPDQQNYDQCYPIIVPEDDPFYSHFGRTCLNFVRSAMCALCVLGPRQQTNQVTTFHDASMVYGNDVNTSRSLRAFDGVGRLRVQDTEHAGDLLPASEDPNDQCSMPDEGRYCFRAGDQRVNQHPALTSLHTIFMRQHNRIASKLKFENPLWSDDKLYFETRRIISAQVQMITWGEFLPITLGSENMDYYSLWVLEKGYTEYQKQVEPTLMTEFSTAAYRFGHSMIDGLFREISPHYDPDYPGFLLRDFFFYPFEIYNGQMDPLMRGLVKQPGQRFDTHLVDDVRNYLYRRRGNDTGLDLAAFNIQRGRDHGLPGYTAFVHRCHGITIEKFSDLGKLMPEKSWMDFQDVYESVEDIDFFSGGTAEYHVKGGVIGPTFACIVGIQFYHLKYGDRFYFEHYGQSGSFTPGQLAEIRKTTLAKIICANTAVYEIQKYAFSFPSFYNPVLPCDHYLDIDLSPWTEEVE